MIHKNKALNFLYWILTGIFVFLFIFLLVKLFPFYKSFFSFLWQLFAPFLISCLLAYLLYPIVLKIHQHRIPKSIAILFIYIFFFGGIGFSIYWFYPLFIEQLRDFNEHLPQLLQLYESVIYQIYESTSFLPEAVHDKLDQVITKIETDIESFIGKIIGGITKIFDTIVLLTVIPVLVFYFLNDYEKIKSYVKSLLPERYQAQCSDMIHAIDKSLGGYIRGQFIICFFVGFTTYIAFQFLGIKYPLLLAIIMGLTNIIPYFGPIIGAIPVLAITITISTKLVIYALIAIFIIQLIEGNLLSPYIVGKSTAIHPIIIIFVLLLGGQISGVLGMIFAVPILTIIKVMTNHVMTISRKN